jgi:mRNA-degrading endonuclease RelE of RelBE toxin-antitoxin system
MKYTVVWLPSAENELARMWLQGSDRRAISAASDQIDRALRINPEMKGRQLGDRRLLRVPPVAVLFRVYPDDRMVKVIQVRLVSI